jgi:hypothetical protein
MIIDKMPAGKYYVGDLCYVIDDEWSEVCDLTMDKKGRSIDGAHTLKDGRRFAMFGTAYGDGEYYDTNGNSYSVDSGSIGCMKVEDIKGEIREDLGNIIDFPNEFYVKNNGGELIFGRIWIDTN